MPKRKKRKVLHWLKKTVSERNLILGRLANERGRKAERRFNKVVQAARLSGNLPVWWKEERDGTKEEDKRGIDKMVKTDVGLIFIQIKSSLRRKQEFIKNRRATFIAVVVIQATETDRTVLTNILGEVEKIRNLILERREDNYGH